MSEPSFLAELKRRNVLRASALYIGAAWALTQGLAQLFPAFGVPDWAVRWIVIFAAVGFPFFVAFAWFFEFTPDGLKRESEIDPADSIAHATSRKLDFWIIGVLAVAVVLLLTNTFVWHKGAGLSDETDNMAAPKNSIAVLPFANESNDKNQDYFSDGISEDLLNLLTKVQPLQVTARTSSFYFKGKDLRVSDIARQLHVAHLLEGSVRKADNHVRITAQLIDAATDTQLWSQSYDRNLGDVFKIQDEIAADVVKQLKVKLLGAAPTVRPTDSKAYALYLQAVQLGQQKTAQAFAKSDGLYRQVLAIDPRYAPAWIGLANNVISEMGIGVISGKDGYADARAAAGKALEIDPDNALAHRALGRIAVYQGDLTTAARQFEAALAIDPNDLGALGSAALLLQTLGRLDQALAIDHAIVRRDPVSVSSLYNLGTDQLWAGHFDEAIASFHMVLNLSPDRAGVHAAISTALLLKNDALGALEEIEQEKSELWRMIGLPMAYFALERKAESDAALAALIKKYARDAPENIAYVYAYRGDADQAFAWLDKAIEYQDPGLSEVVTENLFNKIHADPRWLQFLRKLDKSPEQLAKIVFKVTQPNAYGKANQAPQPAAAATALP